jgi:hypothetical protein
LYDGVTNNSWLLLSQWSMEQFPDVVIVLLLIGVDMDGNPLEIDEQERKTFVARVQGTYRKAVIRMRFFGEI